LLGRTIKMPSPEHQEQKYSDEELEEIMDMHATRDMFSARELREAIRENPLLMGGLILTFGLLMGVALCSGRRKPR
jgi:hypothetical protein